MEYRFRLAILAAIAGLGFWAPWIDDPAIGGHTPALYWLTHLASNVTHIPLGFMVPAFIVLAAAVAGAGAALRILGAAWPPPFAYDYKSMTAAMRAAEGPYLCLRQPMVTGAWLVLTAVSLLMPIGGTFLAVALFSLLLFRLVRREEFFLTAELGSRYRDYCYTVPRLVPRFPFSLSMPATRPQYGRAALAEIGPICVFLTIACLAWSKDNRMMVIAAASGFAVGLIVKLVLPAREYDGKPVE